jgi:MoaA/NifB/PqqE/SkfB family radical SAM enzyme
MCLMSEPKPAGLKAPPELSHQTVRRLIEEGAQNGQASMGFGGLWEPLTSPHIPDLVAFGREKGLVDVMFNTNGLKLDGQTSKALLEAGLTRIMISLDAVNEDTYLLMRPGSDFKTVENNVTELLALRREKKQALPLIRVSFCLTSLNEKELAAFIKRWETRVDFISVQYFGNFKSRSSISTLSPRLGLVEPPTGRCAQPFKRLSVLHDETVLPCCDLSGLKLSVGHLGKSKLMNIWKSPAIDDLRKRLMAGDERLTEDCRLCQSKYQGRQTDQIQNEA